MNKVYRFFFPFTGKVKTQLKIVRKNDGSAGLVKPKDVKKFENEVRKHLSIAFPPELRPIKGYYEFTLNHYTLFKRDDNGMLTPEHYAQFDLDNLQKAVQDCFQPLKKKLTKYDETGQAKKTKKGNTSYELVEIEPGVISDDKFVYRGSSNWVPVREKSDEGIEIYIRLLDESDLFSPIIPPGNATTFNFDV
ncbi:RusA family crossover junction endodeoxyribonuclease [Bacillus sp. Brlt_9]|uniref:RusA family crossover junction endodeoxyribonuclease n=1 Tax=Bacillus sp. Brlt_9 TaxID=3110916 RepID=UPI003F7BE723